MMKPKKGQNLLILGISIVGMIPLVWLVIFYTFTLVCWNTLGHFPIPSLDDPKYISNPIFHFITFMGLIVSFYCMLTWLLTLPLTIKFKLVSRRSLIIVGIGMAIFLFHIVLDPFSMINWLLD